MAADQGDTGAALKRGPAVGRQRQSWGRWGEMGPRGRRPESGAPRALGQGSAWHGEKPGDELDAEGTEVGGGGGGGVLEKEEGAS